jgi:Fic family protein
MIKIEKKFVKNKPFFYLTEQININGKFKKIQVYIGKNIPNDLSAYYRQIEQKERDLIFKNLSKIYDLDKKINKVEYEKIEEARIRWKYWQIQSSEKEIERMWRFIAIQFIFESNAIEGSRLSQKEVETIAQKKYIKKSLPRKEIIEVENSVKAFKHILDDAWQMNERTIIGLHNILIKGLDIDRGFKKKEIIVNNKKTTPPGQVRKELSDLLAWWQDNRKKREHPIILASKFHQRFEKIHPFSDGDGRVGRLIFNWMLLKNNYGPIIFRNKNRQAYFSALDQADEGRFIKLYRHSFEAYRNTIFSFIK